jgi:hypothetical protein
MGAAEPLDKRLRRAVAEVLSPFATTMGTSDANLWSMTDFNIKLDEEKQGELHFMKW